jgi:hypothetical protein
MTFSEASEATLVGIPEIAAIAGVQRTAVSNWRKRNPDFPTPVVETPSGLLFDLRAVERWLIENGKIAGRVPIAPILWRLIDPLRADLTIEEFGLLIGAALVYLEVCDRERGVGASTDGVRSWREIRVKERGEILPELRRAAERIEATYPNLAGSIIAGFTPRRDPTPQSVVQLIDLLRRATLDDETPRFELFEEARDRTHELARFSQEAATPQSLEYLLARLSAGASSVFDPASGEGGVLLMASLVGSVATASSAPVLYGWDINEHACQLARIRFFLYDVEAEIRSCDSLRAVSLPSAVDAVLLDPPYGTRDWGDADLYVSDRWPYGSPPPNSADMAWLQLALAPLSSNGRAFVLLPASSLSRSGREAKIRAAMISEGTIEAVVQLPARLRRDTSIPLVLWCLRAEAAHAPNDDILLVDASHLGTAGRSTVVLEEEEIDSLIALLQAWSARLADELVTDIRLRTVSVSASAIKDGDLRPSRYRTALRLDPVFLAGARDDALEEFLVAESQARAATADLRSMLESS